MPNYSAVTVKDLKLLLQTINDSLHSTNTNYVTLCMCMVWLYEYCVCKAYMVLNNVTIIKDKVITLTTLKQLLDTRSEDFSFVANSFMRARNGIAHGDVTVIDSMRLPALLRNNKFFAILRMLDVGEDVCYALREFNDYGEFNAKDYLLYRLGSKSSLLPEASVLDCNSIKDCEDLISSVSYLL